jgi:hypothetical protein
MRYPFHSYFDAEDKADAEAFHGGRWAGVQYRDPPRRPS